MATKRLRNGKWHYQVVRKNLLPKPIYLTFDDEQEGDAYVSHLEKLLDKGRVPEGFQNGRFSISTIAEAIDRYIEMQDVPESDQLILKVVKDRIGRIRIDNVNYIWAETWISSMKTLNRAPSTIRHHVGALARCFDWVERRGDTMLDKNPLRQLPKRYASGHRDEHVRDQRLDPEHETEVLRILDGGKPNNHQRPFQLNHRNALRLIFLMGLESGMRMREMFTLDVKQIDRQRRTIFLEKTKNGSKRQVPISTRLLGELNQYLDGHASTRLFPWEGPDKKVTTLLSQQFARIFAAAGIPDFTFHGLRHEATCRFYEKTRMTDVQIAKVLGWNSLKMALRYANLRGSDLAELIG